MLMNRIVEYVFFFGLMGIVAFLVWEMFEPFVSALALAAIIVTISFPLYERIISKMPKRNETMAALATTLIVFSIVIVPLLLLTTALVNEALSVYKIANAEQMGFEASLKAFEATANQYLPGFELNITDYLTQAATFLAGNLGAIFAGTASTIFLFFIAMIGSFYLFKDGKQFTRKLVVISPLPDDQDDKILERMALALRSVLTGIVLIALIQGTLTAIGLTIVGIERAVLFGAIAAIGALIPSVGTSIVLLPTIIYLLVAGEYVNAVILTTWGLTFVGLVDNLLGPHLMSRGNTMHPFLILLSVLGGIALFGPIGFIVGPVVIALFLVLLELYTEHISISEPETESTS